MLVEECVSVARWRGRVAENTFENYWFYFKQFLGYLEGLPFVSDPDALVEFQRVNGGYEILDLVQFYVSGKDMRVSTKSFAYSAIRSFFLHNRVALPQDGAFQIRSDIPRVVGSFSLGEVRSVLLACNECYRAVYLCMIMGGLGTGELLHWSRKGLGRLLFQLERGERFIRVDLPGRKRGRNVNPYFSLLGRDAKDALNTWLEVRGKGPGEIFMNQHGDPLSLHSIEAYLKRKLVRLGIIKRVDTSGMKASDYGKIRYGKNPHEFRDFFRTRWQQSKAEDPLVAEFMMGHIVDPLGYNKAMKQQGYVMRQYRLAEPYLNVLSEDPEKVPRDQILRYEEEVRQLRNRIEEMQPAAEHYESLGILMGDPEIREILLNAAKKVQASVEK